MNLFDLKLFDSNDPCWLAFIEKQADANIFHHPLWLKLMEVCYGYHPFVIALCAENGSICAGIPAMEVKRLFGHRRWISLPFSDYCFPFADGPKTMNCLIDSLSTFAQVRGSPKIEIRWDITRQPTLQTINPYVLHMLHLDSDIEKVKCQIHHSHLRNIRIAQKRGVQIIRSAGHADMEAFYNLHLETRHKQGVPVQPLSYFELLDDLIIQKGLGFILLAYYEKKCLAAAVFLHWKKTLTYKYGAADEGGLYLRPNHLIFWAAIQWGCENGYSILDFGRSDVENTGLRVFKNRWGANEIPVNYSDFPAKKDHYSRIGKISKQAIQTLIRITPVEICKLGGQIYYRYIA